MDHPSLQQVKTLIRYSEARSAAVACGVDYDDCHFLDMPFYQTGETFEMSINRVLCARQSCCL